MSDFTAKLNRISGQVTGIQKMIQAERPCLEVVQQIVAVRSALGSLARDVVSQEASVCAKSPTRQAEFDKLLKVLFNLE